MKRFELSTLCFALLCAGRGTAAAQAKASGPRNASNLVTHSAVEIDRPAGKVWPYIVDPSAWKQGLASWHHSGPKAMVGEIFAAGDTANRANVAFFYENVELVSHRRRTIKLYLPSGTLIGYATWWLEPAGEKTRVGYDVYSETPRAGSAPASGDAKRDADEVATNQRRFDAELVALKRLVESAPR